MNGREIVVDCHAEEGDYDAPESFTLQVCLYKSSQERGAVSSSAQGNSTLTTLSQFSKSFNNLFVKDFPDSQFSNDDLKVSTKTSISAHHSQIPSSLLGSFWTIW